MLMFDLISLIGIWFKLHSPPKPFAPETIFLLITKPPPHPDPNIIPKTLL